MSGAAERRTGNSRAADRIQEAYEAPPRAADPARDAERNAERAADLDAVRRCLAGESAAFGEIVARWQDRIHAAVYRMTGSAEDAKDLAQETFVRAWSSLRSFQGGAAFGTWLHSIALNQVRSEMRKRAAQKRGAPVSLDRPADEAGHGIDPPDPSPGGEEAAATKEHVRLLQRAVQELEPEFREVIVLREFQDLSYEEIADVTGAPVGTVRSRLFRAREELRRRLEGRVLS
jgi:RNA polymerase sigma-70 factor (ECF subfamily)